MILRRVIEHARKQEWTAIFIDLVIVVKDILANSERVLAAMSDDCVPQLLDHAHCVPQLLDHANAGARRYS